MRAASRLLAWSRVDWFIFSDYFVLPAYLIQRLPFTEWPCGDADGRGGAGTV